MTGFFIAGLAIANQRVDKDTSRFFSKFLLSCMFILQQNWTVQNGRR